MRWRTCPCCKAANSKNLRSRTAAKPKSRHIPCYWLPLLIRGRNNRLTGVRQTRGPNEAKTIKSLLTKPLIIQPNHSAKSDGSFRQLSFSSCRTKNESSVGSHRPADTPFIHLCIATFIKSKPLSVRSERRILKSGVNSPVPEISGLVVNWFS
jgi:hypothetical protein